MKKSVLLIPFMILLWSCGNSLENKVSALLEKEIKKELSYPESYEPTEILIDSAFTPFNDPEFYNKTVQLYNLGEFVCECNKSIEEAKYSMSIYSDRLTIWDSKAYQEAKNKYDLNVENKRIAENDIKKLIPELKSMMNEPPRFVGYKVIHTYRADYFFGERLPMLQRMGYLIDTDITKVIMEYGIDGSLYKSVVLLYKLMLGENPIVEINEMFEDDQQIIRVLQKYIEENNTFLN